MIASSDHHDCVLDIRRRSVLWPGLCPASSSRGARSFQTRHTRDEDGSGVLLSHSQRVRSRSCSHDLPGLFAVVARKKALQIMKRLSILFGALMALTLVAPAFADSPHFRSASASINNA